MLTVGLITVIFYNHPSTSSVTLLYRTVPIVSEINGRVAEVYVGLTGEVKQGAPIFRLDSSTQQAAAETARRKIAEVDAALVVARTDVLAAEGKIQEARSAHQQAVDELETKQEIYRRNPGAVAVRDIERLEVAVRGSPGLDRCRHRRQAGGRGADLHAPSGAKGQRRSGADPGRGGSGQDRRPGRRERAGRAVRAAGGRHRQSVHASSRCPDPGGRRAAGADRRASGRSRRRS